MGSSKKIEICTFSQKERKIKDLISLEKRKDFKNVYDTKKTIEKKSIKWILFINNFTINFYSFITKVYTELN